MKFTYREILYELATTKDFKKVLKSLTEEEIDSLWAILKEICPEKCKGSPTRCLCRSPQYFQSIIIVLLRIGINACLNHEIVENGEGNETD